MYLYIASAIDDLMLIDCFRLIDYIHMHACSI